MSSSCLFCQLPKREFAPALISGCYLSPTVDSMACDEPYTAPCGHHAFKKDMVYQGLERDERTINALLACQATQFVELHLPYAIKYCP
jgi:hypothetical protein